MTFAIIAWVLSFLLMFLIFFGLIISVTTGWISKVLFNKTKWVAFFLAVSAFILTALAWSVFFRFPSALRHDGLCPQVSC